MKNLYFTLCYCKLLVYFTMAFMRNIKSFIEQVQASVMEGAQTIIWPLSTHGRGADLLFNYVFGTVHFWYTWICSIVRSNSTMYILPLFPLLKLFICGASHRVAVNTIFKVFGVTRIRWIRTQDLPMSKRILYHYIIESVPIL